MHVPIFALSTVLFPGGRLPLRVFEARYLDMIKTCMANATPFGVCLIAQGQEVGVAASVHDMGTLAHVADFDLLDGGLLGIVADGGERFKIVSTDIGDDQLLNATTSPVAVEPVTSIPSELEHLVGITQALLEHLENEHAQAHSQCDDATWVSNRLAESLPMPSEQRQSLLEMGDPVVRLQALAAIVTTLMQQHPD